MADELDCDELWRVRQIALAAVRHEVVAADEILWLADTCVRLSNRIVDGAEKTITADELSEAELRAERADERFEEELQKMGRLEEELIALKAENEKLKAFRPERLMFLRKAMEACVRELDGVAPAKSTTRKRRLS